MNHETTEDRLLGGRVKFRQPARGYRAAVDPVLLAAAVPARPRQTIVDLGAGAGAATLCLASRVDNISVIGVERNRQLAALFSDNVAENCLGERVTVVREDVAAFNLPPPGADHVMMNPPYRKGGSGTRHDADWHNDATIEGELDLAAWVKIALRCVRPKGELTVIHQVDRLADLIAAMQVGAGEITILPLWPKAGVAARRAIVRARRGVRGGAVLLPGLILHNADGSFTDSAEAILRGGEPFA